MTRRPRRRRSQAERVRRYLSQPPRYVTRRGVLYAVVLPW